MPDVSERGYAPAAAQPDLRACVRDLVALSTLPALWTHAEPAEIAESLGDALLAILGCDFVYIRLRGSALAGGGLDCACARGFRRGEALGVLRPMVDPCLEAPVGTEAATELTRADGRRVRVSMHWFGHGALGGTLVAGSQREDFPTEFQRLALGVGVNQAATTLQRHEADQRRRETEGRFQQFMENVPGLAWIKDADRRYVYVNAAAARSFGRTREELLSRTDDEVLAPEAAALCGASDRRVAQDGTALQVLEAFRGPEGRLRHMLVTKFPIPSADPRGALIGGIAIDATERIAAEEALRESDRRKDEFLAMLAHELRNPLSPVRNAAQILKHRSGTTPDIAWAADMIERQTAHMARLIDDLLDVSRITRGAIVLRRERVSLQDVVRGVLDTVRPLMEASSHALEVSLPATPILLDADPTRLAQVLSNLLGNAAKYTNAGGHIRLEVAQESGWVEARVSDNGVGIPREMLGRVFDLFVQVDHSLERAQGGLGIGLTMVQRLAELHGGSVEARSPGPGQGSTFVVRLPLAPGTAAAEAAAPSIVRSKLQHRVLIVDDNRDAAESLGTLLELSGCTVRLAFDGIEGIGLFSIFRPDLVVLDIGLPRMNGYDVVRHLRSLPGGAAATYLALTGFGKEEDRAAALAAGFDFHLTKPVAFERLTEILARLEWRRPERRGANRTA